jgi:transposase
MTSVEVITSVQRRRRWSREEKLRMVAESAQGGRTVSQVARAHGIAPGQLFTWRRELLSEAVAGSGGTVDGFVPVAIAGERAAAGLSGVAGAGEPAIEIRLPNGVVIRVSNAVAIEPLRRVLAALAGR